MGRTRSAVLVAAISLLAACGTTGGGGPGAALGERSFVGAAGVRLLADSVRTTTDSGTARFQVDFSISGLRNLGGGRSDIKFKATGAYDIPHQKARLKMNLGAVFAGLFGADPSTDGGDEAGDVEAILVGRSVYLKAGMFQSLLGGQPSKPWIKTDANGATSLTGSYSSDPSQFLTLLKGVSGKIEEVGTEDVRGTPTKHLRTTIDVVKLVDKAHGTDKAAVQRAIDGLGKKARALKTIPAEVWVDKDNLVRQLRLTVSGTNGSASQAAKTQITMELFDLGKDVDVHAPPPDQVSPARRPS